MSQFQSRSILQFLLLALSAVLILSCSKQASVPDVIPKDVLATVNGVPITETDLIIQLIRSKKDHGEASKLDRNKKVLEGIIQRELSSRKALQLGLDHDPSYQEELKRMAAQHNAFKRNRLTALYQLDIWAKATASEEEARVYFEENESRIQTEVRVWKIQRGNEKEIRRDLDDLAAGMPFEEVAARRFADLPDSIGKPWELQKYLNWQQVPQAWRNALDEMDVGETSGIITGPKNRFWIIKLVARRNNPDLDYEKNQALIKQILTREKAEKLQQQSERELREQATIVYLKDPVIEQVLEDY